MNPKSKWAVLLPCVLAILLAGTACVVLSPLTPSSGPNMPTPTPEPTLDIQALVSTRLALLAVTPTPLPTSTEASINHPANVSQATPSPLVEPASTPEKLHSGPSIAQLVRTLRPSLAYIQTSSGSGSGFVFDQNGLIATNAHVVDCCSNVTVHVNRRSYRGRVLGRDDHADLAVVRIDADYGLQTVPFGNAHLVAIGDEVIALGFPLSRALGKEVTVTSGIVSSIRTLNGYAYFQHDASINPGNSGGPLVNRDGLLIGMNTSKHTEAEGIGYALSVGEIAPRLKGLSTGQPSTPIPTATFVPAPSLTATAVPTRKPTPSPTPQVAYQQVSSGLFYSCALTDAGKAVCWGDGTESLATIPSDRLREISVGKTGACGIREDGKIKCWTHYADPVKDPPDGRFRQISSSEYSNCAVKSDHTVHCWNNFASDQRTIPDGLFIQVSISNDFSCGVQTNGRVTCWMESTDWLGDPPTGTFQQVSTGAYHACGITGAGDVVCWDDQAWHCGVKPDGSLGCWGGNDDGQASPPPGTFKSVSAGAFHTCGVTTDSLVSCWGNDEYGQASAPHGRYQSVSAGLWHTCGVAAGGRVNCWGRNHVGQANPPD